MLKAFLVPVAILTAVVCLAQTKPSGSCCSRGNFFAAANTPVATVATDGAATTAATQAQGAKLPLLLDLGAKKCIPCKMLAPILDALTKEYAGTLDVKFIDVWEEANAAEGEKYGIRTIPTQIYFDKDGKELWRHEGFISKEDLLKKWKELGYDFDALKKAANPKQ